MNTPTPSTPGPAARQTSDDAPGQPVSPLNSFGMPPAGIAANDAFLIGNFRGPDGGGMAPNARPMGATSSVASRPTG
jgi:hypothetical protein